MSAILTTESATEEVDPLDFPALSLTPPWPWTILFAGKRIENRSRLPSPKYRGPIWLHAANGIGTHAEFDKNVHAIRAILGESSTDRPPLGTAEFDTANVTSVGRRGRAWTPRDTMLRGGIVGRARVVGAVEKAYPDHHDDRGWRVYADPKSAQERRLTDEEKHWWFGGSAYVLADVTVVPFVACRGWQGLFGLPKRIRTQLAAGAAA